MICKNTYFYITVSAKGEICPFTLKEHKFNSGHLLLELEESSSILCKNLVCHLHLPSSISINMHLFHEKQHVFLPLWQLPPLARVCFFVACQRASGWHVLSSFSILFSHNIWITAVASQTFSWSTSALCTATTDQSFPQSQARVLSDAIQMWIPSSAVVLSTVPSLLSYICNTCSGILYTLYSFLLFQLLQLFKNRGKWHPCHWKYFYSDIVNYFFSFKSLVYAVNFFWSWASVNGVSSTESVYLKQCI